MATLARSMIRRDRARITVWVAAIVFFTVWFASALPTIYAGAEERQVRAALFENPALRSFTGPGFGLDDYTFGAMLTQEMLGLVGGIAVALMAILLTARHTRAEEETGQAELILATTVGRHAPISAALIVVAAACLLVGLLSALGIASLGLEGVTWPSSLLFGAALSSIGIVFAAVTAVTAQISRFARGAAGLAGAVLAVTFFLRGAGDMAAIGGSPLSWASPIGWAQQTRAYVDDRWWPLLLAVALSAMAVMVAYALNSRRDLGGSFIEPRPGRATATPRLASAPALAWRLQRSWVLWWSGGLFLFGIAYGAATGEVERFVAELDIMDEYLVAIGGTIIDAWLALMMLFAALASTVFAVSAALRPRSEEASGRAEPVLATATSRPRWLGGHLSVAVAGSTILMLLAGFGIGLTAGPAIDEPGLALRLVGAAAAWLPAIWLVVAIAAALYAVAPGATGLAWLVVAYAATVAMFGPLLGIPWWALRLSPFGHVPLMPSEPMAWVPVLALTASAAVLAAAALWSFERRDLRSPA